MEKEENVANIISAVFADRDQAEKSADALRGAGVPNDAISVLARDNAGRDAADGAADAGKGTAAGLGIGAGAGALLGVAAAFIPGVGPILAGGALAASLGLVGASAATGAIVGGISGGVAGALGHWGLNEAEARYYAGEVERGGTWVGVNLDHTTASRQLVTELFRQFGGRMHGVQGVDPASAADEELYEDRPVTSTTRY